MLRRRQRQRQNEVSRRKSQIVEECFVHSWSSLDKEFWVSTTGLLDNFPFNNKLGYFLDEN